MHTFLIIDDAKSDRGNDAGNKKKTDNEIGSELLGLIRTRIELNKMKSKMLTTLNLAGDTHYESEWHMKRKSSEKKFMILSM